MRRTLALTLVTIGGTAALIGLKTGPSPAAVPIGAAPASTSAAGATPSGTVGVTAPAQPTGPKTAVGTLISVVEGGRQFGAVQVQVTMSGGKLTKAAAVVSPHADGHSSQVSSFAIPVLNAEALAAQGSAINVVSGATYTSRAYAQSLQAAIDKARL